MANGGEDHGHVKRERETPSPPVADIKKARISPAASGGILNGLPPMSHSFIGVEPVDEFIIEIADWIHDLVMARPPGTPGIIEVEAKLGLLKNRGNERRYMYPVRTESIIAEPEHKFESNMTAAQHQRFNLMLNKLQEKHRQNRNRSSMTYQHTILCDSFYRTPDSEKIRVTRDKKTNRVVECIRKIRLGDLDIYSPKYNADWRVSVNLEQHLNEPPSLDEEIGLERNKDRISYKYEEFVIDLTQVVQKSDAGDKVMHEIEVEFARPELVESTAAVRGSEHVSPSEREAFDELVRVFVNNVRLLVRNA